MANYTKALELAPPGDAGRPAILVRWSDAALTGGPLEGPSDRALYLMLAVGWQQLFGGHVVDMGDPRKTAPR